MATRMPNFHDENSVEFCVWCAMAHQKGFMPLYTTHANMLVLGKARALQSIKPIDLCCIQRETTVTWWHGSGRSHRDDCAPNIAWICTYNNCLGHIPIL